METFVVHIHRRPASPRDRTPIAGVVERADTAATRPFATLAELLALLGIDRPPRTRAVSPFTRS